MTGLLASRRSILAFGAVAAAAPALAAAAPPPGGLPRAVRASGVSPAFRIAFDRFVAYAEAELRAWHFPAMTLALRAPGGETATATVGYANLDSREPATPDQLFQIGSITKSFVAVALLRLADMGRLALDAPLAGIAPDLPIADARVTTAHILNHSAGLPGDTPPFGDVPGGRLWSATAPGARFSYSNAGYDMMGLLLERLTGLPFDRALASLVLDPLGMAASEAVIRTADRARYPKGYLPLHTDAAWFPGDRLAEGPWLDVDRAAGSIASTPADMLRWAAFVAACAAGRPQPLLSPAAARRFTTAVIDAPDFGEKARYGMGLATIDLEGKPALHHTGGMVTYTAALTVDPANGAGAFAGVNVGYRLNYRPRQVAWYGIALMRALGGPTLPDPPAPAPIPPVADPASFAGRWLGPDRMELVIAPRGTDALDLRVNGAPARIRPVATRLFQSDHPALAARALEFEGEQPPYARLWLGGALFARDTAPDQPRVPPRLAALAGKYRSDSPWVGNLSIVARGDTLVLEGAGPLLEDAGGWWKLADPEGQTERIWFGNTVNGRAQTISLSGEKLIRTPI